jgi:integrase
MRLYKNCYKDPKTNKNKQTKKWYIEFKDHLQQKKRLPAFSDKARSTELGRKLESLVYYRITGEQPDPTLNQWLETLPTPLRDKLAKFDLLDSKRLAACSSLTDHLSDFKQSLIAREVTERQAKLVHGRALKVIEGCKFTTWSNITPGAVLEFLHEQRNLEEKPISAQTSNFYLQAIKQFCKWMVKDRRASESPVAHLQGLNVKAHPQRQRRVVTVDELIRLIDTTWSSQPRMGRTRDGDIAWHMTGPERAMLYMLAAETGLRSSEMRSLTLSSFKLDAANPTVTVAAAYSKRRREDVQPIRPITAQQLAEVFGGLHPQEQVFKMPRRESVVELLYKPDLNAAGIAYKDEQGHVADFHALRHTFLTNLANAGVHPKTAQELGRQKKTKFEPWKPYPACRVNIVRQMRPAVSPNSLKTRPVEMTGRETGRQMYEIMTFRENR